MIRTGYNVRLLYRVLPTILEEDEVVSFFDEFPDFIPNPSASISQEFARLAAQRKWKRGANSKKYEINWRKCVTMEFENSYGRGFSKLESWQKLCVDVGIDPLSSITECKEALSRVYVNIVDLLDCRRTGRKPRLFPTMAALWDYTKQHSLYYPREEARRDEFVRVLLKSIV